MLTRAALGVGVALATVFVAPAAAACGVGAGGAAGLSGCSLAEHEEESRPKWRAGASYGLASTTLRFTGNQRVSQTRHAALATLEHRPTPKVSVQAGLGGVFGEVSLAGQTFGFSPGVIGLLGASYRAVDPADNGGLFMLLTSQLSFAATRANDAAYTAVDLRLGVLFGKTFFDVLTPYATARVFGGPILWSVGGAASQGTDVNKYQVGGGASLLLARRLDLFVEGIPLGERGLAAGAGYAF